jgi:hypothetical protein
MVLPFCHPAISIVHSVVLQFQLFDLVLPPGLPTTLPFFLPRFHRRQPSNPAAQPPPPEVGGASDSPGAPTAVTPAATMLAFVRRHAHIAQPNPLPPSRQNDILQLRRPPFPHPLQRAAQRPPPPPPAASTRPPPHRSSTSTVHQTTSPPPIPAPAPDMEGPPEDSGVEAMAEPHPFSPLPRARWPRWCWLGCSR